jgi:hypothetical protein
LRFLFAGAISNGLSGPLLRSDRLLRPNCHSAGLFLRFSMLGHSTANESASCGSGRPRREIHYDARLVMQANAADPEGTIDSAQLVISRRSGFNRRK